MWTCIALTCSDPLWAEALREELGLLQKQDLLESCLQCIVLEDPVGTVGSGGATLNALLVIVERLSHLKGHTTVFAFNFFKIVFYIFLLTDFSLNPR